MHYSVAEIGTDIIEIDRIRAAYLRYESRFLERICTYEEREYCLQFSDPSARLAGRFAAKEAIIKSISSLLEQAISWQEIKILNSSQGKPEVFFSPSLSLILNDHIVKVSISHCREYASATALLLKPLM